MEEKTLPFVQHFEELRSALLRCLAVIVVGFLFAFAWVQPMIEWYTAPLQKSVEVSSLENVRVVNRGTKEETHRVPSGSHIRDYKGTQQRSQNEYVIAPEGYVEYSYYRTKNRGLAVLGPLEGLSIAVKTSFWTGAALTAPVWGLFLAQFVAPGLRTGERKLAGVFLVVSAFFVAAGMAFAYGVTIPIANDYLSQFNGAIGENFWSLQNYLNYTLFLLLANGVAFEGAAVGFFAVHYGMISARFLTQYRRHAIVLAFIMGAILTPPDIVTQFFLAIPLFAFYEGVILYARLRNRFTVLGCERG